MHMTALPRRICTPLPLQAARSAQSASSPCAMLPAHRCAAAGPWRPFCRWRRQVQPMLTGSLAACKRAAEPAEHAQHAHAPFSTFPMSPACRRRGGRWSSSAMPHQTCMLPAAASTGLQHLRPGRRGTRRRESPTAAVAAAAAASRAPPSPVCLRHMYTRFHHAILVCNRLSNAGC